MSWHAKSFNGFIKSSKASDNTSGGVVNVNKDAPNINNNNLRQTKPPFAKPSHVMLSFQISKITFPCVVNKCKIKVNKIIQIIGFMDIKTFLREFLTYTSKTQLTRTI